MHACLLPVLSCSKGWARVEREHANLSRLTVAGEQGSVYSLLESDTTAQNQRYTPQRWRQQALVDASMTTGSNPREGTVPGNAGATNKHITKVYIHTMRLSTLLEML